MGRLGYYDEGLLVQHEAEAERRRNLQDEVLDRWKKTAKKIKDEDENLTMLQKEARREAVFTIEDAARTEDEYDKVTILWDCIEIIEGWRLAKAEPKRTELLTEREFYRSDTIIPAPIPHVWWRQLLGGNFIDVIYDCPHEIQELTSSHPIYDITNALNEKQKEILYYWAIRLWTSQRIAIFRGQTDRNIRKVYCKMIGDIQQKLFDRLYPRYAKYWNLTTTQVAFIEWYIGQHGKGEIREEIPKEKQAILRRTEHE